VSLGTVAAERRSRKMTMRSRRPRCSGCTKVPSRRPGAQRHLLAACSLADR